MDFFAYIPYIFVIILVFFLFREYKERKKQKRELFKAINYKAEDDDSESEDSETGEVLPYRRKYLLTKNEYWFYKTLKVIAEKNNYTVLAKVRLADLVEVSAEAEKKEFLKYFGKIKSKHIDFILCKKENLYPELLIEVNDASHKSDDRKERDSFIEKVAEKAGYKIIFALGTQDLEEKILKELKSNENETTN